LPDYAVVIEDLWYSYPASKEPVLKGINLKIREGEFLAIMGRTGAGKTTLCLTLNGIIPHVMLGKKKGKVRIYDRDTDEYTVPEMVDLVGMVFQDPEAQIIGMTVESDVAFGPENLGLSEEEIHRRIERSLEIVRLKGFEERFPFTLSGGQKQRLAIASTLALEPKVLVLDEPTSELDPVGKEEVFKVIDEMKEKLNLTIIMVSHDSERVASFADRVVVLDNGEIVMEGPPEDVFIRREELLAHGVRPPEVVELEARLREKGISVEPTLDVNEMVSRLAMLLEKRGVPSLPQRAAQVSGSGSAEESEEELVIKVEGLWHIYPGGVEALKGIDLEIRRGEFVALIGQNGSGKTTLVKHFNGLLKPTKGVVYVKGIDTRTATVAELARHVGYVFQNPDHQLFAETVREEIMFGLVNLGVPEGEREERMKMALKAVGLEGFEDSYVFSLGKGQRQKLATASVMALQPEVLVVDEPTTGMDWSGAESMMSLLRDLNKRGHTIIVITHDMTLVARYARRVVVLADGKKIWDGPASEIFAQDEVLERAFITPPQINLVARGLSDFGIPRGVRTVEEFVEKYTSLLGGGGIVNAGSV